VSDVFARLWDARLSWAPRESINGYLYGAVRYAALNMLRSTAAEHRRYDQLMHDGTLAEGVSSEIESTEDAEHVRVLVWKAVDSLPEPQRLVVTLRWRRGLSWPEVAEALGTAVGAAQMQQTRALKTLRARLPRYLR
jgi:RNA polymerase sigma-70 factor (ECF subfamily)